MTRPSQGSRVLVGALAAAATLLPLGLTATTASAADATPPTQTLAVDYSQSTGDFYGGASGMLYGLGDDVSPTDAILDGARVQVTSQKPPSGMQHPSADVLAVESQFFANGGEQLVVNLQDWYPDWSYTGGKRPGDTRTYNLDGDPNSASYGTYTDGGNGRWDFDEVLELVMNKILANTSHPNDIVFMPYNEPDGANWYKYGNNVNAGQYPQFLKDWDSAYATIQKVWNQYKSGEKKANGVAPTADHALIAGPGDSSWRPNTTKKLLESSKASNTLPDVVVWHELGNGSLKSYRSHYNTYRGFEEELGISPRAINISEFGELRDMSVPGQIVQWLSMFEDTKVQAQTAYWNYAGNLSDNMSRANAANGSWWMYKWYGDLRGTQTVKVTSEHPDSVDQLQGLASLDRTNRKATVLYGGANDQDVEDSSSWGVGANVPVTVHVTGLDPQIFGDSVDVQVRETAYTGTEGMSAAPRVVNVMNDVALTDGAIDVTTPSVDRYAGYQLVITPHQDVQTVVDNADNGRSLQVIEAEDTVLSDGAKSYTKDANTGSWGNFMFSGNHDVGNFKNGAKMTWNVNVPAKGDYRLQLITAPAGFPGTNNVYVDGKSAGTLEVGAELALKDAAKWKYRGSAEIVLKDLSAGDHSITIEATDLDNESDKLLLYQVTDKQGDADRVTYPASDMRMENGAQLSYANDGTNGFADLNGGTVDVFAHAWDAGYQKVTVTYNAPKGAQIAVSVNGQQAATITAPTDGLQSSTVTVAMAEGINRVELGGAQGTLVKSVTTVRDVDADKNGTTIEGEDSSKVTLGGAAKTQSDASSNASGDSWVTGLGNQFVTEESGKNGYGDRTRVKADSNHIPEVIQDNKGTMTITGVPAGTYDMVVRFSNDAFIGSHSYNPQVADLGLQVRQNDKEIARGAFRYTYTEKNFLNRSITVTTDGGALTLGNWDNVGDLKAAVSWGVAPNVDRVTFYPVSVGGQEDAVDPSTLTGLTAVADPAVVNVGGELNLTVTAQHADGSTTELKPGQYSVSDFDASKPGKQTVTVSYSEGRVTRTAQVTVTVVDPLADLKGAIDAAEGLDGSKYTAESWAALQVALEKAKDALASGDQAAVDAAAADLKAAIDALDPKPAGGEGQGEGEGEGQKPGEGEGQTPENPDQKPGEGETQKPGEESGGTGAGEGQEPGAGNPSGEPAKGGESLSATGAAVGGVAVAVALLAAVGAVLVLRRRRA